ncbi:MAG: hypothetical protein NVS9B13_21060 [Candidatus Acidiferrum sp.]
MTSSAKRIRLEPVFGREQDLIRFKNSKEWGVVRDGEEEFARNLRDAFDGVDDGFRDHSTAEIHEFDPRSVQRTNKNGEPADFARIFGAADGVRRAEAGASRGAFPATTLPKDGLSAFDA